MVLEAVWFKNGKEIDWVDPVEDIFVDNDSNDISAIEIWNGYNLYSSKDCQEEPDDFIIRIKKDN